MQESSLPRGAVMYYDPYEECPDRTLTQPTAPKSSDSSPLEEKSPRGGTTPEDIPCGTPMAECSQIDTSPTDEKFSTAPRNFQNGAKSNNCNVVISSITATTGRPEMLVTANSFYCPADYADPAALREQNPSNEHFHETSFCADAAESHSHSAAGNCSDLMQEKNSTRQPIPAPRASKTTPAPPVIDDDGPLYDEPWDLKLRRLELENRFKAAVGDNALIDTPNHRSPEECSKLINGEKLTDIVKRHPAVEAARLADARAQNRLSDPNLGSDSLPVAYDAQQCGQTWSVGAGRGEIGVGGKNMAKSVIGEGEMTDKVGAPGKDGRGQEGYDKPWDLKPHLKDDRPAVEYEAPWDQKSRDFNLVTASTSQGAPHDGGSLPPANMNSRELDTRPGVEYDQPWDQKKQHLLQQKPRHPRVQPLEPPVISPFSPSRGSLGRDGSNSAVLGTSEDKVDPKVPLELQSWYHGVISRQDAEALLRAQPEGSFLVRTSESNRLAFSLSLKSANGFMHMKIVNEGCRYILGQFSQPFYTIPQMIHHYGKHKLPIKGAEHISLVHPISNELL